MEGRRRPIRSIIQSLIDRNPARSVGMCQSQIQRHDWSPGMKKGAQGSRGGPQNIHRLVKRDLRRRFITRLSFKLLLGRGCRFRSWVSAASPPIGGRTSRSRGGPTEHAKTRLPERRRTQTIHDDPPTTGNPRKHTAHIL